MVTKHPPYWAGRQQEAWIKLVINSYNIVTNVSGYISCEYHCMYIVIDDVPAASLLILCQVDI